jgi:hypothetical protein
VVPSYKREYLEHALIAAAVSSSLQRSRGDAIPTQGTLHAFHDDKNFFFPILRSPGELGTYRQ